MESPVMLDTVPEVEQEGVVVWNPATKIGFRFAFSFFGLLIFPFPLGLIPYINIIATGYDKIWQNLVPWVGKHILHVGHEILRVPTGSGDTTWSWVHKFCVLSIAIIATLIWSVLDRKRPNYTKLYRWFAVILRYQLASAMFVYGMDKVFPLQMPAPRLSKLIEPYGDSSPMGILWTFIGASKGYEIFAGSVETIGGLLLIFPRTAMVGAMVSAGAMLQVWMLNMCYDVPVKLYSFQLMIESVFLLLPMLPRLADLLVFQRTAKPRIEPPLFKKLWANRVALAVQIMLGLYLFGTSTYTNYKYTKMPFGYLAPRPPLYGIWDVNELTVDGQDKPPLVTDTERWRRIVFPGVNQVVAQPMNGPLDSMSAEVDTGKKTINLKRPKDEKWKASLTYDQPSQTEMVLDGDIDGHKVHAKLARYDESKFLLTNRGFHWIQEFPFNR